MPQCPPGDLYSLQILAHPGARRLSMTEAMLGGLMAVVAMAAETNVRANAYSVRVDERFR